MFGEANGLAGGLTTLWVVSLFGIIPGIIWFGLSWWVLLWPFAVILAGAVIWWVCFIVLARLAGTILGALFGQR